MSTAGHCDNIQYTTDGIYFGLTGNENGWLENDPVATPNPIGPFGEDMDIQVHDSSVRSFDLTNEIYTGASSTAKVISSRTKADTRWEWVCKNGRSTGTTCGQITDIAYAPSYAPVPRYVRVDSGIYYDIACGGDSGSPIFQFLANGVAAFGILSGTQDSICNGGNTYFFYTPIDEINRAGYSILTTHYKQYFVQNVWWTETTCTEYKQALDGNGNSSGAPTSQPCLTNLPAGSSGTIESYTAYVVGNHWREAIWRGGVGYTRNLHPVHGKLREAMWRNNVGYVRDVPLNATNTNVDWASAPAWQQCCTGSPPRAQGGDILTQP